MADDLPDVRLFQQGATGGPTSAADVYDLDKYAVDNDSTDAQLNWGVNPATNPNVAIDTTSGQYGKNMVDLSAYNNQGLFPKVFTVTDELTDSGASTSSVKLSTFWISEPRLSSDNRFVFPGPSHPAFTYVIGGLGTSGANVSTMGFKSFVQPQSMANSVWFGPPVGTRLGDNAKFYGVSILTGGGGLTPPGGITDPGNLTGGGGISFMTMPGLVATVLSETGQVYMSASGAMTCPYFIAIPAWAVSDGSWDVEDGNWDGTVIMVAKARYFEYPASINAAYPREEASIPIDSGFDSIPSGAPVQVGQDVTIPSGNTLPIVTGGWYLFRPGGASATTPAPTYRIISNSSYASEAGSAPASFDGAHSGNVLRVSHNNASGQGPMVCNLVSRPMRGLQPGQIYVAQLNYTTNVPAVQAANYSERVSVQLQVQIAPDNTFFTSSRMQEFPGNPAGVVVDTMTVPSGFVWQQLYVEFMVPENAFDVPDVASVSGSTGEQFDWLTNMFLNIRTTAAAGTPNNYNVYIDNVYVYEKCATDLNFFDANSDGNNQGLPEPGISYGSTSLGDMYFRPGTSGNPRMMEFGFEGGSDLDANNGWRNYFTAVAPTFPAINLPTGTNPSLTMSVGSSGRLNSGGCLQLRITNGTPNQPTNTQGNSVGVDGGRVLSYGFEVTGKIENQTQMNDPSGQPLPDQSGASYYGLSLWVRSDAPDFRSNPHLKAYLNETRPGNQQQLTTLLIGPTGMPRANDGWMQFYCVGAFGDWTGASRNAMERAQIIFEPLADAKRRDLNYASVGATVMTKANQATPGYNANAQFYVDDVVVHKVNNDDVYFNVSLFQ
jgi:hypothetical protein